MTVVAVGVTVAYLLLAIADGGGGFAAFFSNPVRIAPTIMLFAQVGAALFTSGNASSGDQADRSNCWVIVAFSVIGLLAVYLPA